jgi:hypothetical protein
MLEKFVLLDFYNKFNYVIHTFILCTKYEFLTKVLFNTVFFI